MPRFLAVALAICLPAACLAAEPQATPLAASQALERLMEGNARYVAGEAQYPNQSSVRRAMVSQGQSPIAVIVGCSDSRVPPEIVFDRGIGDLFIVRTAGQAVEDDVDLGSIEYAVDHLHVPLIVVLGHERCGAVDAALKGMEAPGHIQSLVVAIRPAVEAIKGQPGDALENAINANIRLVTDRLRNSQPILAGPVKTGELMIVGARYDFHSGKVTIMDEGK